MIISASYKTDIPAFYAKWFRNRLEAGYCRVVNPYNRNLRSIVSFRKQDVDGFVFWTKNIVPFIDVLAEVRDRGFPFILQYTINGYPRALESRVVDAKQSINSFRRIANDYGSRSTVWRYDTIIFSTFTDANFHRENFAGIASELAGATDEVVVSFVQLYKKTRRNMDEAARVHDFSWEDPPNEEKRELLKDLLEIATHHKMRLSICTQPALQIPGVADARCVDAERLMDVAGVTIHSKARGMRAGCGCFESRDIGDYDTCPHGCVYCYAVRERSVALSRYRNHDPESEYLFPQMPVPEEPKQTDQVRSNQLPLFVPEDRD